MRLRSAKSSSEKSNSDPVVSELVSESAVQAAESQVKSSPLVGKAGTATGNKKSKC